MHVGAHELVGAVVHALMVRMADALVGRYSSVIRNASASTFDVIIFFGFSAVTRGIVVARTRSGPRSIRATTGVVCES